MCWAGRLIRQNRDSTRAQIIICRIERGLVEWLKIIDHSEAAVTHAQAQQRIAYIDRQRDAGVEGAVAGAEENIAALIAGRPRPRLPDRALRAIAGGVVDVDLAQTGGAVAEQPSVPRIEIAMRSEAD